MRATDTLPIRTHALCVLCFLSLACSAEPPDRPSTDLDASAAVAADSVPEELFAAVEERLLERTGREVGFRITSEGAFAADLSGELEIGPANEIRLTADGTFGGDPVSLSLDVAGDRMVGGNAEDRFDEPVPPALRESVVLGLTRMGLLHNLARLVAGSPPDHAGGGVREWVRPANMLPMEVGRGVVFDVVVNGQETASAVLRVDERGLPASRAQTVRFPGGEMRVRESYAIRDAGDADGGG